MSNKYRSTELNEAIILLQNKQAHELALMQEQFHLLHEYLKPGNLIKSALNEVVESPEIKNNMVNNAIGLVTGFLTKNVLFGSSRNPLAKVFGNLLQFAVTNVVSKHPQGIKSFGESLFLRFLKYRKAPEKESKNNNHDLFI